MKHGTLALLLGLLLAAVVAAPAGAAPSCPWMNTKLSADQRAHELVSAMTIDQKIAMLSQAQPVWAHYGAAGFVPGQSSLCIPDLVLNDAGQGVGDLETNTTAFPAPIAQSSSWDPVLQWRFGAALGWQAWHKGINVQLAAQPASERGHGRPALATATFTVADTGPRLGAEVAQLYVADPRNAGEPPKQLKGFQKVLVRPGARTKVKLALDFRSLAHWSDSAHRWKVGSGCYRVRAGDSSSNLPLSATIAVGGARCKGAKVHVTNATLRRAARGHST